MDTWRSLGNLDIGLLRTFVAVIDYGGVAQAARHVGRSQPAASLQLKRLEEQVGSALFRKTGRRIEPTAEGHRLAPLARQLLALHDRTLTELSGTALSGRLRLGVLDDFADHWLTGPLVRFARLHPAVSIQVHSGRRGALHALFAAQEIDLLLTLEDTPGEEGEELGCVPVRWIGVEPPDTGMPVPLVALDGDCRFREMALDALRKAGRAYRIAFSSPALPTQWQAVQAGFGVSLRSPIGLRPPLRVLQAGGLPPVPSPPLHIRLLMAAQPERPVRSMAALLRETVAEELRRITP